MLDIPAPRADAAPAMVQALREIREIIVRPGLTNFDAALDRLLEIQELATIATTQAEGR